MQRVRPRAIAYIADLLRLRTSQANSGVMVFAWCMEAHVRQFIPARPRGRCSGAALSPADRVLIKALKALTDL